ncbi:MAG: S46 family peptidase [Bacteroidota bacterium]|nr:S46 family peptidase [Bacteroidota bacterium]
MTKIYRFSLLVALFFLGLIPSQAKEGIWLPILLEKYNIAEMHQMGFKLSAQDIYDVNHASMKDAVVIFGSGCTGELISQDGLLITNHHCGFDAIQSHSSLEHDYLTNGYWAKQRQEELPNPSLTVTFLVRMADVTDKVFNGVTKNISAEERRRIINSNIDNIEQEATKGTHYEADVKPFFNGNQYFLFVNEIYRDVRLVGAPPSAIGKFGGDTDNWMWPRHTGDFSLFRIYTDKNGNPAPYSPDNIPLKSKKSFPISLKGVKEGDFTMVFGYPGRTSEYLPSAAVKLLIEQTDPKKIAIRDIILSLMKQDMDASPKVRIQYASKNASSANAWKKWQGEIKGLKRMDALSIKKTTEQQFMNWVNLSSDRKEEYGNIFQKFDTLYSALAPYSKAYDYYNEIVIRGTDAFALALRIDRFLKTTMKSDPKLFDNELNELKTWTKRHFKDYNASTDEKIMRALLKKYNQDIETRFLPRKFLEISRILDSPEFSKKYYYSSILTNETKINALYDKFSHKEIRKLEKDPLFSLFREFKNHFEQHVDPICTNLNDQLAKVQKQYMKGILQMNEGKPIYPDANFTLRVAYGKVEGFYPVDGVYYDYYTTLTGIMQKDNPEIYDYAVPEKLKELYKNKDFGRYAMANGQMPVAFTASDHTTGGNSGSPVVDAEGRLIGVNFDRCWEGTMSDVMYDPTQCRNIVLDIRYALFLIDKFAGAGYLLNEMKIEE